MKLTYNFSLSEFACNNGDGVPIEYIGNVCYLADQLQVLRDTFNKPITVLSGYRGKQYNESVGGAKSSKHLYAQASDIVIKGISSNQIYNTIEKLITDGLMSEGGLGLYSDFVHYDIRKTKARWTR